MRSTRHQITMLEAASIVASSVIGVGVLALPRLAVSAADTGAPIYLFLAICLAGCSLGLVTILGVRYPSQTIIQYSEQIIGKWPARIVNLSVIIFFTLLTALAAREFATVVGTSVLQRTPSEVTTVAMILLAALFTRNSISTFSYTHFLYLPFIVAPACCIAAFSLKNGTPLNLQPVWGNDHSHVVTGILTLVSLFQSSFIIAFVIPSMRNPKKAMQSSMIGLGIAGGVYLFIVIACLAVFGPQEIKLLSWPTLELAKTTMLPGEILERLDAAFLAVWVTAVFTTVYATYYLTTRATQDLFKLRDHRMFSFGFLTFVFIIAMLPTNITDLYVAVEAVGRWGLVITIGYPILLGLMTVIRPQRGG